MQKVAMIAVLAASLCAGSFWAQSSSIQGVVSDNSGAVIPGAQVQVTDVATGVNADVSTNEAGFYVAPGLNPGIYKITATADGFAPQERPQLRLEVGSD